jgi:pyruvate/2-oxoglutarate dehydrogenase complex dihydrolipoamide dehydrogenase (E3) component
MKAVDIAVIGAGSAGLTVAYTGKGFGKSVMLIDRNLPGGECTRNGCIPSKAFIHQANDIFTAHKYADFIVDSSLIMQKTRQIIDHVSESESVDVLKKDNIDYIQGNAKFIDNKTLDVDGRTIKADKIFICTGSIPSIPPISGIDAVDLLTNENFFLLDRLPESMIVLGAGPVGIELSQAMNRLGVKVDLVEMADSILPKEDRELVGILQKRIEAEGVKLHISSKAVHLFMENNRVNLVMESASGDTTIRAQKILCALGRIPGIKGLDLEKAGVEHTKAGITVNQYMQTTCKGIYAAGDVTGKLAFSHMANAQGILAVRNAVLPFKKKINYENAAWCTFTSPELAAAGMSENAAREKFKDNIRIYKYDLHQTDRAKTKEDKTGMVKLICNRRGEILGCGILGEYAGDLIGEIQVVKTFDLKLRKLADVIHPYPTYAEVFNKIGKKALVDDLLNFPAVRIFRKTFSLFIRHQKEQFPKLKK